MILKILLKTILYLAFFLLVILIAPGLPPYNINFESYTLDTSRKFEGVLTPNNILDKAEHLLEGQIPAGPESIAIRGDEIYSGVHNGDIIRVKNGKVTTIAKIGVECEFWESEKCGRVGGMRFDSNGKLIVVDLWHGVFSIDVDTGNVENIFSTKEPVEGKLPGMLNDLDISKDGMTIYVSETSSNAKLDDIFIEALGNPSGRLFQIDRKTKEATVLIRNLHDANGVQLSSNEEFVMVAELFGGRVWRYFLKGPRKGEIEIMIKNIPGTPDNIRPNGKGGYYLPLFYIRSDNIPGPLLDKLGPYPLIRKLILRVQYSIVNMLKFLEPLFPDFLYLTQSRFYIQQLGWKTLSPLPEKVVIIEFDEDGKIIGSLQNDKLKLAAVSQISIGKEYAYLGAPFASQLLRIKIEDLERK